jgi:hypothetical protein
VIIKYFYINAYGAAPRENGMRNKSNRLKA